MAGSLLRCQTHEMPSTNSLCRDKLLGPPRGRQRMGNDRLGRSGEPQYRRLDGRILNTLLAILYTYPFIHGYGGGDPNLQVILFLGVGLGGQIQRAGPTMTVSGSSNPIPFEFSLGSAVTLQPGSVYTFTIGGVATPAFSTRYGSNTYSGGQMFNGTFSFPNRDLYFREGLSVPEPSSWILMTLGTLAFARCFRRKRA